MTSSPPVTDKGAIVPSAATNDIRAAVRIVQGESDLLHPEAAVRAAAAHLGRENGPRAEIDLQLGSTHKTVIDDAFSDDALEWLFNPPEEEPPFIPLEMHMPADTFDMFGPSE